MTFAQYTTTATTNCGGSSCHSGAVVSSRYFVGNTTIAMDPGYSEQIISTIRGGSMPRGRATSTGDKATLINYLCGHLDI